MKLKSVGSEIENMGYKVMDNNKHHVPNIGKEIDEIDEIVSWQLWCNIRINARVEIFGKTLI